MEKNKFKLGDYVSCKKWNGEQIYGIYAYQGGDGSHFIVSKNKRRWNIKPNDIRAATKAETQYIKDTIEITLGNTQQQLQAINQMREKLGIVNHIKHYGNNIHTTKQKELEELEYIAQSPIE